MWWLFDKKEDFGKVKVYNLAKAFTERRQLTSYLLCYDLIGKYITSEHAYTYLTLHGAGSLGEGVAI